MAELFRPPWTDGAGPIPRYLVRPTQRFMRIEAAGGIVIVSAAIVALIWANVWTSQYASFWSTALVFDFGILELDETLKAWVSDGLMVLFFYVVGLEIKREAVHGELANPRQAALPLMGALGGMIVPALIFVAFNAGREGGNGWGIPVATDIAFAVGVLALLGRRVPLSLKIFLLTLAVADDVGGILIIAVFYPQGLSAGWLAAAIGMVVVLVVMNRVGIRATPAYLAVGLAFWLCTLESGVEATIAGVVLALITPARSLHQHHDLGRSLQAQLGELDSALLLDDRQRREDEAGEALRRIEAISRETQSPLERMEYAMAPWSSFVVIPIFALANAGIYLGGGRLSDAVESEVAWGVALGLVLGKVVGVTLFSYLAVRIGVAALPSLVGWRHIAGVALLGGIGFTVSIFIATLAFPNDAELVENAKIGIFAASMFAAVVGYLYLRRVMPVPAETPDAGAAEPPAGAGSSG